ncbi:UNVERIFIED_CONTAM: hypothetical protein HDU68_005936 [Siphonaria sp. JEL0065]|nr:hypothetical protein HDU68_005936 [Siphonaria sp. JEL0065]
MPFASNEDVTMLEGDISKLGDVDLETLLNIGSDSIQNMIMVQQNLSHLHESDNNSNLPSGPGGMSSHMFGSNSDSLFGSNMLSHDSEFLALMSPYINMGSYTDDSELLLTPIISPAITPSVDFANMNLQAGSFSPLSSPALRPSIQADGSGTSTNPGVKRPTRRTSAHTVGGVKKKAPPRSPYTIPRANPTVGVDPLRISSPMLKPTVPRKSSSSLSPEATSPGANEGNNGASSFSSSGSRAPSTSSTSRDPLFKVPHLPASRMDSKESTKSVSERSSLQSLNDSRGEGDKVNAVTPGMLLYLKSDEEKEAGYTNSDAATNSQMAGASGNRRKSAASALEKGKFPSPSLKPLLPALNTEESREAVSKLTQNSNYRNIMEGESDLIGFDASEMNFELEVKKEHHKVSEQKRRDSMKQNFDNLKHVLPQFSDKNPSKEKVLQFSREYIIKLKQRVDESNTIIAAQKEQNDENERIISELRAEIETLKRV